MNNTYTTLSGKNLINYQINSRSDIILRKLYLFYNLLNSEKY